MIRVRTVYDLNYIPYKKGVADIENTKAYNDLHQNIQEQQQLMFEAEMAEAIKNDPCLDVLIDEANEILIFSKHFKTT